MRTRDWDETPDPEDEDLDLVSFSSLQPEPVEWLWPGRIPLGKVTVISGEPGLGKSLLTFDIAARVSRGNDWPEVAVDTPANSGEHAPAPQITRPGSVLLLNADDHLADAVGPCLDAAGADRQWIVGVNGILPYVRQPGAPPRGINLVDYLPHIKSHVYTSPDVRLIIIDPLSAYCGRIGRQPTENSRRIATTLSEVAAELRLAILVVTDEHQTGLPSRTTWHVQRDPLDEDLRLWVPSKFHYGPRPAGLGYRIDGRRIVWDTAPVRRTAEELAHTGSMKVRAFRQRIVSEWLLEFLSPGPREATEVYNAGEGLGLSPKQIWRAKSQLSVDVQIRKAKDQKFGKWIWELPQAVVRDQTQSPSRRA